jgi:DNA-binding MarR family transcriptional regulator
MQMQRLQRQQNLGLLIAAARRRLKQAASELARPYHLSPQRFWLLLGISDREGLSLRELAAQHRIDEPTASRIVAGLVEGGLVRVADDPEDRRRTRLLLTGAGANLARQFRPLAEGLREATVEGLSSAEQKLLAVSLQRVVDNVDRFVRKQRQTAGRLSTGGEA